MKKHFFRIALLLAMPFSCASYASETHYAIFIDAGSSGSRLHMFEYETGNALPKMTDIFSEKIAPGLSSFEKNPEQAGVSYKKLLDDALTQLQSKNINPSTVPVSILATAGMRLLDENSQQKIYENIRAYLSSNYSFPIKDIQTIPGKMEGLYDWLDVNYIKNNFTSNNPTAGIIDMGGASTEIAFSQSNAPISNDIVTLKINGTEYTIFSKSFLGLGQNSAEETIEKVDFKHTCLPINYPISAKELGQFNFTSCTQLYENLINKYNVTQNLPPLDNQTFYAFSGIFYVYDFFNVLSTPDETSVNNKIQSVCSQTWDSIKIQFPKIKESYLKPYCSNASYFTTLLNKNYHVNNSKITVTDKIQGQELDWTLGALLYEIITGNIE